LLKAKALEKYSDKSWSGLQVGSLEYLISQLVAEASSLNSQYLDFRSLQSYLETSTIYRDVLRIAENVGLFPQQSLGAVCNVQFVGDASVDVTIPIGTTLSTSNGTEFCTSVATTLNSGNSYTATVECIHSDFEQIVTRGSGQISERIETNRKDVLLSQSVVTVNGTVWTRVNSWADSSSSSQHYQFRLNDNGTAYVLFGDGTRGTRLSSDASVVIDLFTNENPLAGNAQAIGTITTLVDSFTNSSNISTVSNTTASSGGKARDSIEEIRAKIPAQQRQVSGLVNKKDLASALKKDLGWLADATSFRTFENIGGVAVPTNTVYAYPYNNTTVSELSTAQQTELNNHLANRGELGVQWSSANALTSSLELGLEVKVGNKNLEGQKSAEISNALTNLSASSLFHFSNLGFNKSYKKQQILDVVDSISDILFSKVTKFSRIPVPLVVSGSAYASASFLDLEIGSEFESEDGRFRFEAVSTTECSSTFHRPFKTDQIGVDYIRDTNQNYIVEEINFSGSAFNDTTGPWVKALPSSGKLQIRQNTNVWSDQQFSASDYTKSRILRIQYVDENAESVKECFYHISSSDYQSINCVQTASSPLNSANSITGSLSGTNFSNVRVWILKDQTNQGSEGFISTPNGQTLTCSYNTENTLYLTSDPTSKVPVGEYSHINFREPVLDLSTGVFQSHNNHLRVRLDSTLTNFTASQDVIDVYTTNKNSSKVEYKEKSEVFTLETKNIQIRFI